MTPYSPYIGHLSPRLQELFGVPYLDQSSASPTPPKDSPVLRQLSPLHALSRIASPSQAHQRHQSPANSLRQRTRSPIYWRTSPSPSAQIGNAQSSIADLKNTASNLQQYVDPTATILRPSVSRLDWFQAFTNFRKRSMSPGVSPSGSAFVNLLRTYVIELDTYEAEMQKQNLDDQLSVTEHGLTTHNIDEDCRFCMIFAKDYLHLCTCEEARCRIKRLRHVFQTFVHNRLDHPTSTIRRVSWNYITSYTVQFALQLQDSDLVSFWLHFERITVPLGLERKSSDLIKILQTALQELSNERGLDAAFKKVASLQIASVYIHFHHCDMAEKLLRNVLKEDFFLLASTVSSCAEMALFHHSSNKRVMSVHGMGEDELTTEGLAYLETELGEERMAERGIYIYALTISYRLHEQRNLNRIVEVTDEQENEGFPI